ncbi:hypothetical protein BJ878DRAFT_538478 [Calycina marina]|uniref:Uncharacterized protein n=1 Tax=Calycina marina TaxID=1763456 RepID=A0A9P8CK97_9HELO|nr:hypothetical protein BJ878DRAFT_538478 [Calycina marina]
MSSRQTDKAEGLDTITTQSAQSSAQQPTSNHTRTQTKDDEIAELKIQNAVPKNELNYLDQAREDALKGTIYLTKTLVSLGTFGLDMSLFGGESKACNLKELKNLRLCGPSDNNVGDKPVATVTNSSGSPLDQYSGPTFLDSWKAIANHAAGTNQDIGIHSLNDVLQSELGDDEQVGSQLSRIASIPAAPAPTVREVGFAAGASFRGNTYDNKASEDQANGQLPTSSLVAPTGPRADQRSLQPLSNQEREDAIHLHRRSAPGKEARMLPEVFRYGVFYEPEDHDTNFMRTVVISNISAGTKLGEVLARVHGGAIVKSLMGNTMTLREGMTVLIQFADEVAADDYVSYTASRPLAFGPLQTHVNLRKLDLPTYPSFALTRSMKQHGQTRCLVIKQFPEDQAVAKLKPLVASGNQHRYENLLNIHFEGDNLHLEFSSVGAAGSIFGLLSNRPPYRYLEIGFEQDPCDVPVEDFENAQIQHSPVSADRYHGAEFGSASTSSSMGEHVNIPSLNGSGTKSEVRWADEVSESEKGDSATAREVSAPEVKASDIAIPEVSVPEVTIAEVSAPAVSATSVPARVFPLVDHFVQGDFSMYDVFGGGPVATPIINLDEYNLPDGSDSDHDDNNNPSPPSGHTVAVGPTLLVYYQVEGPINQRQCRQSSSWARRLESLMPAVPKPAATAIEGGLLAPASYETPLR